jgi:hypothetical protein
MLTAWRNNTDDGSADTVQYMFWSTESHLPPWPVSHGLTRPYYWLSLRVPYPPKSRGVLTPQHPQPQAWKLAGCQLNHLVSSRQQCRAPSGTKAANIHTTRSSTTGAATTGGHSARTWLLCCKLRCWSVNGKHLDQTWWCGKSKGCARQLG